MTFAEAVDRANALLAGRRPDQARYFNAGQPAFFMACAASAGVDTSDDLFTEQEVARIAAERADFFDDLDEWTRLCIEKTLATTRQQRVILEDLLDEVTRAFLDAHGGRDRFDVVRLLDRQAIFEFCGENGLIIYKETWPPNVPHENTQDSFLGQEDEAEVREYLAELVNSAHERDLSHYRRECLGLWNTIQRMKKGRVAYSILDMPADLRHRIETESARQTRDALKKDMRERFQQRARDRAAQEETDRRRREEAARRQAEYQARVAATLAREERERKEYQEELKRQNLNKLVLEWADQLRRHIRTELAGQPPEAVVTLLRKAVQYDDNWAEAARIVAKERGIEL